MPYKSRWELSPPHVSVPSFLFGSPTGILSDAEKILLDWKRPETHSFSLHSLREWSKRFAAGLTAAGIQQGDRVMLVSGNNFWTPVIVLGVVMAGGIYNSANPASTARELEYQLKDSEPRFVFAAENCLRVTQEAAKSAGIDQSHLFLFEELPSHFATASERQEKLINNTAQHWGTLITTPQVGSAFRWDESQTAEMATKTAILIYSSGTTGLPKGVEVTHSNLVSTTMQLMKMQLSDKSVTQRRSLCVLPMYHGLGLVYFVFVASKSGLQSYMMQRYNLRDMLSCIDSFKITELLLVPPILLAIAKHPSARNGDYDLSSVRKVVAGAAPLGTEVTQQFEEIWSGRVRVRQAWGMSEIPCIAMCWNEAESSGPSSISVGELVPGVVAKLVLEDGTEETRPGSLGELWVRGPNVMKGYWRKPKETSETITADGWLKSGDIAYRDENNKWYIVDRKKELIKVRGAQVAPAELEALLLEHPQILDAAVIGLSPSDDEDPRAYVVPRHAGAITEEEIVEFVASKVSKIKRLTGGVGFLSSIPKNPSGKILRRELREYAKKQNSNGTSLKSHL
ncbi:uncharacterized protein Z519_02954 [Cladophialophora bantiana CBS 173.52]|uniref:4-coumarate-CoA ligase n=1 Tax=Cladophialophora bantiana (strain ATCC 10958 / CBS 173.52 / CDC B-1940 / NIH 8579) TaxID=1442370 RepID=A0A0D2IGM4_CLAB1|nr:uncharacterized protein Z519_02954 [Cladophialophora bantiana CBS 173.52]KIW95889.1 hypothetical protein Z519_02954 [Cladophialophora bantiana CBS 173.52]